MAPLAEGPRLGHPGNPPNHRVRPNPSGFVPGGIGRLWPVTTIAAASAMTGLIALGFVASLRTPAATPVVAPAIVQETGEIKQAAVAGPPLFTGSIPIETVEVTPASLGGPLFGSGERPQILPQPAPQSLPPLLMYSTALAPSPPGGLRTQTGKPRLLTIEPVRLANLSPQVSAGMSRPAAPLQPQAQTFTIIVAPGETLGAILNRYGLQSQAELALVKALRGVFAPKDLRAGQEVILTVTENSTEGRIPLTLTLEAGFGEVAVSRNSDGSYTSTIAGAAPGTAQNRRAISRIQSSLYGAARAQKVPDSIIVRMMNTHSYDVDFQREIRPGDTFEVFYTRGRTDGISPRGRGTLLYSSLTTSGKQRRYYRFTTRDGDTDYYDQKGVSSKKPLMRTPLNGARISSGFGMRRHPVLGYTKMHTGTDFAAPRGTPIYAAGDGRIEFAGRNGSFGNYIRLDHDNGVKTAYAHMKGIARGIKKGGRVRQGQVIGYVGSSGRSTGSHLHYEISINGKKRNPLKVKIAGSGRRLKGKDKTLFTAEKQRIDKLRQALPVSTLVASKT